MNELKPWAVFVSGSRDFGLAQAEMLREALRPFTSGDREHSVIIHGAGPGNPGCDWLVEQIAFNHFSLRTLPLPALWAQQKKGAGPIRNTLCAAVLLAHARAGYRPAFRGFSTGGAGTEGAAKVTRELFEQHGVELDYQKIDVTLG